MPRADLGPEDRVKCLALLAWLLEPVVEMDQSPRGRERGHEIRRLVHSVLASVDTAADWRDLRMSVMDDPDYAGYSEPEPPASYRSDILAVLDSAVRAALSSDRRWLSEGIAAVTDSLYFVQQRADDRSTDLSEMLVHEAERGVSVWSSDGKEAALGSLEPARSRVAEVVGAARQ